MRAVFFSDLHIVNPDDDRARAFEKALDQLLKDENLTHLFLVGDIFDLWVGPHEYFSKRFKKIVERISELVRQGVAVHYFEGNHDLHVESFWRTHGVKVHAGPKYFDLGNQIVRVEHGDLINPEDTGYLALRGFLRSTPLTWLAHKLPSVAVKAIGERASKASRGYTSNAKALPEEKIRQMIRTHAQKVWREKRFDILVSGHVHVRDDHSLAIQGNQKGKDGSLRSINLGSWYDGQPKAFAIADTGSEWLSF